MGRDGALDLQNSGTRALVKGSSSGIGEAIARALASEGATLRRGPLNNIRKRLTIVQG